MLVPPRTQGKSGWSPALWTLAQTRGFVPTVGSGMVCDVGDRASYNGLNVDWISSISSDVNESFVLTGGTAVGTAVGGLGKTRFQMDGSGSLRYNSAGSVDWNALHKNNAKFTMLFWVEDILGTAGALMGNTGSNTNGPGVFVQVSAAGVPTFAVLRASADALREASTLTFGSDGNDWSCFGLAVDEAAATGLFFLNGQVDAFTSTYTSPSSAAAAERFELMARGSKNQSKEGFISQFIYEAGVAWTEEMFNAYYQMSRGRYGV